VGERSLALEYHARALVGTLNCIFRARIAVVEAVLALVDLTLEIVVRVGIVATFLGAVVDVVVVLIREALGEAIADLLAVPAIVETIRGAAVTAHSQARNQECGRENRDLLHERILLLPLVGVVAGA
jgi:hypothetical protein